MSVEQVTAPDETGLLPVVEDESGSLADHAEAFGQETRRGRRSTLPPVVTSEPTDDDQPLERERHRAKSQKGTPDDVEAIAALTKRLRDAESEAGFTIERKEGESERVYNLRRKAEQAEALRDARKLAAPQPAHVAAQPVQVASEFADAEPTIEQFKDAADPYSAWQRALNAWDRKKERWDEQQQAATGAGEERKKAALAAREAVYKTFGQRVVAYQALPQNKDYEAVVKTANLPTPPLLETALVGDPDGPRFIHQLAKNTHLFDEFFLLTDGKPVTHDTVATVQRLLKSRMPAAVTGSVATSAVVQPPRPPNPVRTGAMRTVEKVPDDDGSLADHARAFGSPTRRRR